MRSAIKNYMGMIAIAIVALLVVGAIAVRVDREQVQSLPNGINATPAISGNAPTHLVDVRWLMQYESQVDYIFDLGDIRMYEEGHIPGAHHIWWQDAMRLHTTNYGEADHISVDADDDPVFSKLNLDVPQNARIILYDSNNSERASWLMWVMKINGYTDVYVLDGGLQAWIGANGEVTTDVPASPEEQAAATPTWNEEYEIRREDLERQRNDPNVRLVDTRSVEEQKETVNGTVREGHIPNSINIPTADVMRDDGTFKSPEELQELFTSHGIDPDDQIVVYSLFTVDSGNVWLAFQIAGYENVVIYQEGFVAWAFNEELPLDTEPYPTTEPAASPAATPTVSTPAATAVPSPISTTTPQATPDDSPTDLTND